MLHVTGHATFWHNIVSTPLILGSIANDQGNRTTPLYVEFADGERILHDAVAIAMTCVRVVFNLGHAWSMHVRPAHDTH